jgi:hypothetical protein
MQRPQTPAQTLAQTPANPLNSSPAQSLSMTRPLRRSLATLTSLLLVLGLSTETLAQTTIRPSSTSGNKPTLVRPTRPAVRSRLRFRVGVRPSSFRIGGLARSAKCTNPGASQAMLTSIVPPLQTGEKAQKTSAPVDKTIAAHPTIWLHVPQGLGLKAKFTLQDVDLNKPQLYRTEFTLSNQAGIVGIQVPETAPALVVGHRYIWQVSVICDANRPDRNPRLGSWLERIDPAKLPASPGFNPQDLARQLEQAEAADKAPILADLGIWQDALSILALQRKANPQDLQAQQDWRDLLKQNQLEPFLETAPILNLF